MKFKKLITFLSALTLTLACVACTTTKKDSSTSTEPTSSSVGGSSESNSSSNDPLTSSEDPGIELPPVDESFSTQGTMTWGVSLYHGGTYFSTEEEIGHYTFGACQNGNYDKQWVYMPFVEGNNKMTFTFYARDAVHPGHNGAFKLGINNVVYTYDGETNTWKDENGDAANVTMKTLEGEDVDWSDLRYKRGWPHTVFTITGVSSNVEIIYDFSKCELTAESIWKTLYGCVYNIYWGLNATNCDVEGHVWKNATCTLPRTCSVCGETEGEALGHNYGEWIERVEATPEAEGMEAHYFCDRCEGYFDENKVKTPRETLVIAYDCDTQGHAWEKATCTLPKTCSVCELTEGDALGHDYGTLINKVEQTTDAMGMEAHYCCERCDTYFDENKVETSLVDLLLGYEEIDPLAVDLPFGGDWPIMDEIYLGFYSFGTVEGRGSKKVIEYKEGYNTLTFKITTRWGEPNFPRTFKLLIDGCYFEYKEVDGKGGWYNGDRLNKHIKMGEEVDNYTFLVLEISHISGTSNVEIHEAAENGKGGTGWGVAATFLAKEFVWSRTPQSIHPEEPFTPAPTPAEEEVDGAVAFNETNFTADDGVTYEDTEKEGKVAHAVTFTKRTKLKINPVLVDGKGKFTFEVYVPSSNIAVALPTLGSCELVFRVNPTLPAGANHDVVDGGSGYIGFSSAKDTLELDQWQTIEIDISTFSRGIERFAFDLEPGTIYLRNLVFSGTAVEEPNPDEPNPDEPKPDELLPLPVELPMGGDWPIMDEIYAGAYSFGTVENRGSKKTVAYVNGYNTLTFKIATRWGEPNFPKTFKLLVDGVTYEHKEVGGVAGWYNGETLGTNIKTTELVDGYTWLVFEITGIKGTSDVQILEAAKNGKEAGGWGVAATFLAKDFVWSYKLLPLAVELPTGGDWPIMDEMLNGAYSFGTVAGRGSKKTVAYVNGYNTLTFKIATRWGEENFPKTFKLLVDGVVYEYKEVSGVAGWYNGETLATNIKTSDYKANETDYAWLAFEITNIKGTSNVEILEAAENGKEAGGWGVCATYLAKDFVWSYVSGPEAEAEGALEFNASTVTPAEGITYEVVEKEGKEAYKVTYNVSDKFKVNTDLMDGKTTFTFEIYVGTGETGPMTFGDKAGEVGIRVKPTLPEGDMNFVKPDGTGYIYLSSVNGKLKLDKWNKITLDISAFADGCTEFAFEVEPLADGAGVIYLRNLMFS